MRVTSTINATDTADTIFTRSYSKTMSCEPAAQKVRTFVISNFHYYCVAPNGLVADFLDLT